MTKHEILNLFHYIRYETTQPSCTLILTDVVYHPTVDQSGTTCSIEHRCGKHRINRKKIHVGDIFLSFKEESVGGYYIESAEIIDELEYKSYYDGTINEPFSPNNLRMPSCSDEELLDLHWGLLESREYTLSNKQVEICFRGHVNGIKRIRAELPKWWADHTYLWQYDDRPENERTLLLDLSMGAWHHLIEWGINEKNKGIKEFFISLKEQMNQMFPALFNHDTEMYPISVAPEVVKAYKKKIEGERAMDRFHKILFAPETTN